MLNFTSDFRKFIASKSDIFVSRSPVDVVEGLSSNIYGEGYCMVSYGNSDLGENASRNQAIPQLSKYPFGDQK